MLRAELWTVLSLAVFIAGCNDVTRPDTSFCTANVKFLKQECYNLLRDYDKDGKLLKDAKPEIRTYLSATLMLDALDKSENTDPVGWANLKTYLKELRAAN